MIKILTDIKAFLVELVSFIGGIFWGNATNWDFEPMILIIVSGLALVISILLFLIEKKERPFIDLELNQRSALRSPPEVIGQSPMNEDRTAYVIERGNGVYRFEFKIRYELVIYNNSNVISYNTRIYINCKELKIKVKHNPLLPVEVGKPIKLECETLITKISTHGEADKVLREKPPENLKSLKMIVSYQNENRETFYTSFIPYKINKYDKVKISNEFHEI